MFKYTSLLETCHNQTLTLATYYMLTFCVTFVYILLCGAEWEPQNSWRQLALWSVELRELSAFQDPAQEKSNTSLYWVSDVQSLLAWDSGHRYREKGSEKQSIFRASLFQASTLPVVQAVWLRLMLGSHLFFQILTPSFWETPKSKM